MVGIVVQDGPYAVGVEIPYLGSYPTYLDDLENVTVDHDDLCCIQITEKEIVEIVET